MIFDHGDRRYNGYPLLWNSRFIHRFVQGRIRGLSSHQYIVNVGVSNAVQMCISYHDDPSGSLNADDVVYLGEGFVGMTSAGLDHLRSLRDDEVFRVRADTSGALYMSDSDNRYRIFVDTGGGSSPLPASMTIRKVETNSGTHCRVLTWPIGDGPDHTVVVVWADFDDVTCEECDRHIGAAVVDIPVRPVHGDPVLRYMGDPCRFCGSARRPHVELLDGYPPDITSGLLVRITDQLANRQRRSRESENDFQDRGFDLNEYKPDGKWPIISDDPPFID